MSVCAAFAVVQGAELLHTVMSTTTQVTNIVGRAYADTGTTPPPKGVYYVYACSLGYITNSVCTWDVGQYTAWHATNYFPGTNCQVAMNGNNTPKSAMQAAGFGWGGYMRHYEVPSLPVWQQPTIRYCYAFTNYAEPSPFAYGNTTKLVGEFDCTIPTYNSSTLVTGGETFKSLGWGYLSFILIDRKAGVSAQPLSYCAFFFDTRGSYVPGSGIAVPGGISESAYQVGSGEMMVRTVFSPATKYCTLETGSVSFKTNTFSSQHFGISISRAQLLLAITNLNTYMADYRIAHGGASPTNRLGIAYRDYSTNPDDYRLGAVNVAVEAALDFVKSDGSLTPTIPFNMGFSGKQMKAKSVW